MSLSTVWRSTLCVLLLLFSPAVSQSGRRPRQADTVRVDSDNVDDFAALVEDADEGTTFEISVDVSLSSPLNITAGGVTIIGTGSNRRKLTCSNDGGIVVRSADVRIEKLSVEDCFGGAVAVFNDDAVFDPFDVDAVYNFTRNNVSLVDVAFLNNAADPDARQDTGGAVTVGPGTLVVIVDCLFVGNRAKTGGAVLVDGAGSLTVRGSTFEDNTATIAGGAIAAGFSQNFFDRPSGIIVRRTVFRGNRDLAGAVDPAGLRLSNGAPLENAVFLNFPSPAPSGGAMYISGYARVILDRCTFEDNTAVPSGGALYLSDGEDINIDACTFTNNSVTSLEADAPEEDRNVDLEMGGAIYLVFTDVSSRAVIDQCTFTGNKAAYGGAIHAVTELAAKLSIVNCQIEDNEAELAGGAILLRNIISVNYHFPNSFLIRLLQARIRNVRLNRNKATVGGGMMLTNGAGAGLFDGPVVGAFGAPVDPSAPSIDFDIYFTDNIALDGGGMFLLGAGQVTMQAVRFTRNRARRNGGGICVISSLPSGQTSIQTNHFHSNAAVRGGAIFVDGVSNFELIAEEGQVNEFIENKAMAGGALHVRPSSQIGTIVRIQDTNFTQNRAVLTSAEAEIDDLDLPDVEVETSALGRRLSYHRRLLQVDQAPTSPQLLDPSSDDACRPGGGGAMCLLLASVPERAPIEISMSGVEMESNAAHVGGAMFASTSRDEDWIADCASVGTATESLTAKPCKSFSFVDTKFTNNVATSAGGAIFASHPSAVFARLSDDAEFVSLSDVPIDADIFAGNEVGDDGFGNNAASSVTEMIIIEPIKDIDALLFDGHNSGEELPEVRLELKDVYNQTVTAGIVDAAMSVSINSSTVSGQRISSAESGIVTFSKTTALGRPVTHPIVFVPNSLTTRPIFRSFSIRQCHPGESRIDDKNICDICDMEYFGFNYNFSCDGCPDNAKCPGNATLVPIQGYWHSTPYSPIMHECILEEACSYFGRKRQLEKFYEPPSELVPDNATVPEEEYPQCAENYTGILCGSCVKGYGHIIDGECVKCKRVWVTAVLIVLVCFWTLFLLVSTFNAAFDTIRDLNDMRMVRVLTMNTERTGSVPAQPARASMRSANSSQRSERKEVTFSPETSESGSKTVQSRVGSAMSSKRKFESMSGDENVDHIMASEKVSETIKILTNFFQITSVGVGINASWTESIRLLLVVEDSVSSVSSGASFAPMECLMENLNDRTLIGVVLRTLFPLVMTVLFIIGTVIKHREDDVSNRSRRVIIGFLVGIFFAYDTVTEMLMRIVNCIALDDPDPEHPDAPKIIQHYARYATARDEYWIEDTAHVCWQGNHGLVAGILGVPGLIVFTFGIPFFLAVFLVYKRYRGVVLEPECLNTYGFVYQSYQAKFVFWESIVMLRKVSMAAVIVYAYDLGPNLQSAIALGILIFALLAQFLAQPFKYSSLNMLESLSLLASIFIFYSGVVFRDGNTSYAGKVVLSIIIVSTNVAMVCLFLYRLFVTYDHLIIVKLRLEKVEEMPETAVQRIKLLSKINATKMKEGVQEKLSAMKSKISQKLLTKDASPRPGDVPEDDPQDQADVGDSNKGAAHDDAADQETP